MEATGPKPEEAAASTAVTQPAAVPPESYAAGSPAKPEEIPTSPAPNFSPVVETPVAAAAAPAVREQPAVAQAQPGKAPVQLGPPVAAAKAPVVAAASTTPATALAPARVGEVSGGKFEIGNLFAIILVLAGIGVIGWVIVFEIRRREIQFPSFRRAAPATDPQLEGMEYVAPAPVQREMKVMPRLTSGPRQVSLKLKASEPSLRREVVPLWTPSRLFGGAPAVVEGNGEHAVQPVETSESEFESVAPVIAMAEPAAIVEPEPIAIQPEPAIIETPVSELTTPVNMPEPIHEQWAEPAAPEMRPPVEWAAPVAEMPVSDVAEPAAIVEPTAGAVQTAVHLTFAFEIASMQLTPTFKMGALQLRPASKVVTMRLAGSAPQPEMPQVTFEIARIQPAGGTLGSVRLTPSQQQCPTVVGSPSFTVGGLHLVSDFAAAPLQLTPSQQGQATVQVVAPFQIANVEFSPSFEISSIVLNSNSNQVSVQMPSAGGAPVEGAPVFEISNLQLTDSGEIEMMQLNLLGHGPKSAA
jgi:hypothetical protein